MAHPRDTIQSLINDAIGFQRICDDPLRHLEKRVYFKKQDLQQFADEGDLVGHHFDGNETIYIKSFAANGVEVAPEF